MVNRSDLNTELKELLLIEASNEEGEGIKNIEPDIVTLTRMSNDKLGVVEIKITDAAGNSKSVCIDDYRIDQHFAWVYLPEIDPETVPPARKAKIALATLAFASDPNKVISELPADVLNHMQAAGYIKSNELTRQGKRTVLEVFLAI
jgi:hypothetical protein